MQYPRSILAFLCAFIWLGIALHSSGKTPLFSENFDAYTVGSELIGLHEWKSAGLETSQTVSILENGSNPSPAVAINAPSIGYGTTAEIPNFEPFTLPVSGGFTYEFDFQRDSYVPGTALEGGGNSYSIATIYAGNVCILIAGVSQGESRAIATTTGPQLLKSHCGKCVQLGENRYQFTGNDICSDILCGERPL